MESPVAWQDPGALGAHRLHPYTSTPPGRSLHWMQPPDPNTIDAAQVGGNSFFHDRSRHATD